MPLASQVLNVLKIIAAKQLKIAVTDEALLSGDNPL